MPQPRTSVPIAVIPCLIALLVSACSSPTGPSEAIVYIAELNVPGGTGGILTLTTRRGGFATVEREEGASGAMVVRLAAWLVRPAWAAQSSEAASGRLTTDDSEVIALTGTFSNQTFNVSGGGYTISASVSSTGALSGGGTAPGGVTASVAALTIPGGGTGNSSIAKGRYKGSFTTSNVYQTQQKNAAGAPFGACNVYQTITGTLDLDIEEVRGQDVSTHLVTSLLETQHGGTAPPGPTPACAFTQSFDPKPPALDFDGPASSLQYMSVISGPCNCPSNGTASRTLGFTGAVSGNTIVGTVILAYRGVLPITSGPAAGGTHTEWYPLTKVTVTLTKQ